MMMAIGKYGGIWVCLSARLSEVDLDGELCGRRDDHHTHDDDDDYNDDGDDDDDDNLQDNDDDDVLTNQLEGFIIYF